jgi:hypothetical protein
MSKGLRAKRAEGRKQKAESKKAQGKGKELRAKSEEPRAKRQATAKSEELRNLPFLRLRRRT